MKGIVFTEFLEMVEAKYSLDVVDQVLSQANPACGGAYTAVGTYDAGEMVALLTTLSRVTETPAPALLEAFGRHLIGRFATLYPGFFAGYQSAFDFLPRVDNYIHVEVRKLYPDAELPTVTTERVDGETMNVIYRSPRCMGKLARGLIEGCAAHFGEAISITEAADPTGPRGSVRFTLRRHKG